ncbi:MAG: hypothetical protein F6K03_18445 [Kamptonema sp. SIO4C4]|nr:hypothetical protein [Kamptonema sp. SIO4C4]
MATTSKATGKASNAWIPVIAPLVGAGLAALLYWLLGGEININLPRVSQLFGLGRG